MVRKTSDMWWQRAEPMSINDFALYIVAFPKYEGRQKDKMLMAGKTVRECLKSKQEIWRPKWMARVCDPETNGC